MDWQYALYEAGTGRLSVDFWINFCNGYCCLYKMAFLYEKWYVLDLFLCPFLSVSGNGVGGPWCWVCPMSCIFPFLPLKTGMSIVFEKSIGEGCAQYGHCGSD